MFVKLINKKKMEEQSMACSCKELDEEVLNDAKAFLNGEVTIQDLMSNPTKVDGDRAKLIDAIHTLYKDGSNHEDFMRAIDELKEVAEKGDIYANTLLGVLYSEGGEIVEEDDKLAEAYLTKAKDLGGITGEYRLGILYLQDNLIRNPELGVKYVESAAMKGLKEALNSLGDIYMKGVTVEKNVELAKKYYKLAADRNRGEAFHNLALLEEDEKKANELEDEAKLFGYNKEDKTQNYLLLAFQK